MKSSHLALIKPKIAQRGAAAVEFALVAIPFFLLMFGAMEFGRLLYLWNTVQEVTRNAARLAVVTDFTNTTAIATIKRAAVFRATDGPLPAASEITNAMVNISYLNALGNEVGTGVIPMPLSPGDNISACLDSGRVAECIRFVEVCVSTTDTCQPGQSVQYAPMVNLFSFLAINIPMSTVRMPVESLGFQPDT